MVRPLLLGYFRVLPHMTIDDLVRVHHDLVVFAKDRGFALGDVFVETRWQQLTSWIALTERCKRDRVRDVVVPSSEHLSATTALADLMRQEIQTDTGARLWLVES